MPFAPGLVVTRWGKVMPPKHPFTISKRTMPDTATKPMAASPAQLLNRGWIVTFAGTGINLALGVLYTWSMFKGAIEKSFGWDAARLNDPYALCCLVFAF